MCVNMKKECKKTNQEIVILEGWTSDLLDYYKVSLVIMWCTKEDNQ